MKAAPISDVDAPFSTVAAVIVAGSTFIEISIPFVSKFSDTLITPAFTILGIGYADLPYDIGVDPVIPPAIFNVPVFVIVDPPCNTTALLLFPFTFIVP